MFTSQWALGLKETACWLVSRVNVTANVLLCFSSELVKGKGKKRIFKHISCLFLRFSLPCFQIPGPVWVLQNHCHTLSCTHMQEHSHTAHPAIKTNSGGAFWKHSSLPASQFLIITKIFFSSCYITPQILYFSEALTWPVSMFEI